MSSRCYVVEVVYTQDEEQKQLDHSLVAAVDIGVNNLVVLTSNKRGFVPIVLCQTTTTVVTKGQKRGDACSERGEQELGGYVGKTTS